MARYEIREVMITLMKIFTLSCKATLISEDLYMAQSIVIHTRLL